jgi:hypothetical protein
MTGRSEPGGSPARRMPSPRDGFSCRGARPVRGRRAPGVTGALAFGERIAALCARVLGDVVRSMILHGSLALGDYAPGRSDIDLLVIVDRPLDRAQIEALTNNPVETRRNPGKEPGVSAAQKWSLCRDKAGATEQSGPACHAEGRGFESHQPLESPANRYFSVVRAVWLGRRRSRVRSPYADLRKAPASRGVPAASSRRFVRADEVFLSRETIGGQNPRPQRPTQRPRGSTISA